MDEEQYISAVSKFMDHLKKMTDEYWAKEYPNLCPPTYAYDKRPKYDAIFCHNNGNSRIYCFISRCDCILSNGKNSCNLIIGDVLKPASWKKPALHARGNVIADNGEYKFAEPHGIVYLRY